MVEIEIQQGDLLKVAADAIVNPANSGGTMGGGVAGVIRAVAGACVEAEAMKQAPIPVGAAIVTPVGRGKTLLAPTAIIHAPTMRRPAEAIPVENVNLATAAALALADRMGYAVLAFPGMGTGVGRVTPEAAAHAMLAEITRFQARALHKIVLIDMNPRVVAAWRKAACQM